MHNVYFKGKSTDEFGLITKDIGRRNKSKEQIERIPIPYRSGDLVIHSGSYESYSRQMVFTVMDNHLLPEIFEWLDGYGELRTDIDEGGFFLASVDEEVEQSPNGPALNDLSISFLVEPFFYLNSGKRVIELKTPKTLLNAGTTESDPIITIYGSGDIKLNVNSQFVSLKGVENSITMDSKNKMCYRDTLNMGKKMIGKYIRFNKGTNAISWTGNVTKVEIIPRWCER